MYGERTCSKLVKVSLYGGQEIVFGQIIFANENKMNQAKVDLTLKIPKHSTLTEVL